MAIQFNCSKCGALIEVDDHYAGGQCECPACNTTVEIPHEAPAASSSVTPPAPPSPTQPPPPTPRMSPPTETATYLPPEEPGKKGWATAALVFAILGFCVPLSGLLGAVCGIVAILKVSHNPREYGGKGLAISGIIVGGVSTAVILIIALMMAIMLPPLARARELSKRAVCAANLKGMGVGFYTYANENNDFWPSPFDEEGKLIPPGGIDYVAAIGSYRGKYGDPDAGNITKMETMPSKLATTRGMWSLIQMQISTQKSFICPSSNDAPNADSVPSDYWDFGNGDIIGPATSSQALQGWSQVSYGYQVPFGKKGRPSSNLDLRMPLASDKGPFGAALDGGLSAPPPISANQNSTSNQWRPWNSPNHGGQGAGEGQNVLYADAHVDWANKPIVGLDYDNIFTQWSADGTQPLQRIQGNCPTPGGKQTPAGDTDTLIYP